MPKRLGILALLFIVSAGGFRLSAQTYGEITGTVTDTTGASIDGALVSVRNTATSQVREVHTNPTGSRLA